MERVKVLVLGLGNFGHSWAAEVLPQCAQYAELVAVVDHEKKKWLGIDEGIPKYTDLETAIAETMPELVINVTPPGLHCSINESLLKQRIGVLCEKPIADSYENAVKMGSILQENGGFLMIGENYRYHTVFRKAKEILLSGELGRINRVVCHFSHYHPDYSMFYHGTLAHPLLEDVSVHHLDLARYLTGQEPLKVWCKEYAAEYCWYGKRPASALLITEMTGDVVFHYDGTLAAPASTTDWNGDWEISCDRGILKISNHCIRIYQDDEVKEVPVVMEAEDSRVMMLREACMALQEKRPGETDFTDNFKTFGWLYKAIRSSETGMWIGI
ncbi:MAG: Gfo/Idh/MocA family oxidoreductase [Lachnospiraceae bacterium]|nr:Gfo/Idh/MocA family oxidoreductase [Lachnospiraceae bacterium]